MDINLKEMSRKELLKLRADIDKAIENAEDRERKEALKAAEKAAAEYGFSLDEIAGGKMNGPGRKRSRKTGSPAQPKYRNPANPADTWTGRGRQPRWFKEALEKGVDPAKMEV